MKRIYMRRSSRLARGSQQFAAAFKNPTHVIVEIGSFGGEFSVLMSPHFKEVYAIDPWDFQDYASLQVGLGPQAQQQPVPQLTGEVVESWFDENTAACTNIHKLKGYDYEFLLKFPERSIDVLYIDSLHTFADAGLTVLRWYSRIKSGGVLAGHDNSKAYPEIQRLVRVLGDMLGQEPQTFEDFSWAFRVP